jgi:CAAX protease family protein
MRNKPIASQVAIYLLLVYALSTGFYVHVARAGHMDTSVFGLMWCPGVAGILTILLSRRALRGMGWKWRGREVWSSFGIGFGIPIAYALVAYALIWGLHLGTFPNTKAVAGLGLLFSHETFAIQMLRYIGRLVMLGLPFNFVAALGEEIGWRGFLVPTLHERLKFAPVCLISGIIWATWHYALIFAGPYRTPDLPAWYAVSCFTVMVLGSATIAAWLRLRSGSVWPCAIYHASHNLFIQSLFTPLTEVRSGNPVWMQTRWWIDEFGAMLAITIGLTALIILARYRSDDATYDREGRSSVPAVA